MSGDTFHTARAVSGPAHGLRANPAPRPAEHAGLLVQRVVIGALLNAVYQADGKVDGRVLYLLDEAARLNRMSLLESRARCRAEIRDHADAALPGRGQLVAVGVPGKSAWYASTSWRSYAGVQDYETALGVSRGCRVLRAAATRQPRAGR